MTRFGIALTELLVALAIGSLVLGLAASASLATRRVHAALDAGAAASARTTAVPRLLAWAIGRTGRGVDGCAATVANDGRLWRGTAVDPGAGAPTTVEVLVGIDGAGRPALYHRTRPWVRQPWLEDVTGFVLLEGRDGDGSWRAWTADGATRWTAVRAQLAWTDGDARIYEVALPHRPCATAP